MGAKRTVPVTLLGQEFRIRSDAEVGMIRSAASLVDETMARVRDRTGTVDTLDVAVLAALNIAHRLLAEREQAPEGEAIGAERLLELAERVEAQLASEAPAHSS